MRAAASFGCLFAWIFLVLLVWQTQNTKWSSLTLEYSGPVKIDVTLNDDQEWNLPTGSDQVRCFQLYYLGEKAKITIQNAQSPCVKVFFEDWERIDHQGKWEEK